MSKANHAEENALLAMLAYRVTPRGPGELSPAGAMTQCKVRALLPIKQYLLTQLNASKEIMKWQRQAEHYDHMAQLDSYPPR